MKILIVRFSKIIITLENTNNAKNEAYKKNPKDMDFFELAAILVTTDGKGEKFKLECLNRIIEMCGT
jgi:hypothetical protein